VIVAASAKGRCRHVAVAGVDAYLRAFGNGDGKIQTAAVIALGFHENGVAADGDVCLFGIEDFLGVGVGVGEGDFVGLHLDSGVVACSER